VTSEKLLGRVDEGFAAMQTEMNEGLAAIQMEMNNGFSAA
jgi:hypothetical protein